MDKPNVDEFKKGIYGFPKVEDFNPNTGGNGVITPIRKISNVVPPIPPVIRLPPSINCDEVFVPVSPIFTNETTGRYIVSNYGRVYDYAYGRFVPGRFNDKYRTDKLNSGYFHCHLSRYITPLIQESHDWYLHRIVLMSFYYIPGCEQLEVNHKNGVTIDNRLCNLEWVTPKENIKNCMKWLGRDEFLVDPSDEMIHEICQLLDVGMHPYDVALETKVHVYYICGILDGSKARDIACQYKFYEQIRSIYPDSVIHYICQQIANGFTAKEISYDIGIDKYFIRDIAERKIYNRISNQYSFMNNNIERSFDNRIPDYMVHEICRLFSLGYSTTDVVDIFKNQHNVDISIAQLQKIKNGTTYTHIASMYNKNYSKSTIDESKVRAICMNLQKGLTNGDIARKYDIPERTIARIRRREVYADISKDYTFVSAFEASRTARVSNGTSLSDEQIINVCNLLMQGLTPTKVSEMTSVKPSMVNGIKSKNIYQHITSKYDFPMLEKRFDETTIRSMCTDIFINKMRNVDVMAKYDVSSDTVKRIKAGKMHKNIVKDYINR